MKKYLAKIQFDCNDSDYVYGVHVIDESTKDIIEKNARKKVRFGSCDFGENSCRLEDAVFVQEITEEEAAVLAKLGLRDFGESLKLWFDSEDEEDEEEEEDDNDGADEENKHLTNARVVIKNIHNLGYLMIKNENSLRQVVVEVNGKKYESVSRKGRATSYTIAEAFEVLNNMPSIYRENYELENF